MVPPVRSIILGLLAASAGALAACAPDYSPNTYASGAVQQANKVEPAVVVGYREVAISANGSIGAVTGGAAGGVLGTQSGSVGINSALGAVGGTMIGTLLGTSIEHMTGDTTGWEYIVRKPNGDMLSVTQREERPLALGQKVLVITGSQARIVPDYAVAIDPPPAPAAQAPVVAPAAEPAPLPKEEKGAVEVRELPVPEAAPAPETPPAGNPAPVEPAPAAPVAEPAPASPAGGSVTAPVPEPTSI